LKTISLQFGKTAKKGIDRNDFKTVFDALYEPLKNYIYYKSGDIACAEDIVQESFLKLWEKRNEVILDTIKPYLYKIANNIFINRHEQKKVVFNFVNSAQQPTFSESPEFELEMKEFDVKLQQALANLSEKERVVFLMNRLDDKTYNQIAEELGISVKAVEKRMNHALVYLRNNIEQKF